MGAHPGESFPAAIGKYRLLRELGRGSMGVVYEAEQQDLGRRVALKVLAPAIANDEAAAARFGREARAAAQLEHPNIAAVHEFGRDGTFLYYSMELVEGPTLQEALRARRGSEADAYPWIARVFADLAHGLQAAHDGGVIHRDVKPSNILLTPGGAPKIVDFGLARVGSPSETLTTPGALVGTLQYMSPEQATAGDLDARTDVYSLGASLYEALTGRPPFEGDDAVALISRIVSDTPAAPRRVHPGIPRDLETITLKAMSKDRRLRYRTARLLAEDLERFVRKETIVGRRPGPLLRLAAWATRRPARAAGAAALALAAALVATAWPAAADPPEPAANLLLADFAPGADLAGAGIRAEARISSWAGFLVPGRGLGLAVVTHARERRQQKSRPDLCAFGPRRRLLWTARSAWPDYESTFGWGDAGLTVLDCLVARPVAPVPEETLVVYGYHHGRGSLIFADPQTGAQRGSWDFPEAFTCPEPGARVLGLLPDWSGAPRRLLATGRLRGRPSMVLLEMDGTFVRRYDFPVLGTKPGLPVGFAELKCDWSREGPEVVAKTDEGLFVALLVKDRLLDLASARASLEDGVEERYDEAHEEGAFERAVEERGGFDEFLRGLAGDVREEA